MEFEPRLEWDGPDDDGDYIVALMGLKDWHLAAHGSSPKHALVMLADAIMGVAEVEARHIGSRRAAGLTEWAKTRIDGGRSERPKQ